MSDSLSTMGRFLVIVGGAVVVFGLILILAGKFPGLKIGRLPGDIYIERDGWRFYFPLMTSIIISIIVSMLLWFISRR